MSHLRRHSRRPPRLEDPWTLLEARVPRLRLGPMLRHITPASAVIWMELSARARVEVQAWTRGQPRVTATAATFAVGQHHYALVALRGLRPGRWYEYRVVLRGEGARQLWPDAMLGPLPPSVFCTPESTGITPLRLAMYSCRRGRSYDVAGDKDHGPDALLLLSRRLQSECVRRRQRWPHAMLMMGDQIYADDVPPSIRAALDTAHAASGLPEGTAVSFEEHAQTYLDAWKHPELRWLFSCIPTLAIFDDHDVIDDWNISAEWKAKMAGTSWWFTKYASALLAYWLYQGAGNLHPDDWDADERMRAARRSITNRPVDATGPLQTLFTRYALGQGRPTWSYSIDLNGARLVVADLRFHRDLTSRDIMDDPEWTWLEDTVRSSPERHLLLVSSLPYLLPDAIHELETSSEASNSFPWNLNPLNHLIDAIGFGPKTIREDYDMEHWSAFSTSFNRLLSLLEELRRPGRVRPAFIGILSGDVHFCYNMLGRLALAPHRPIYQLVSSGARNLLTDGERLALTLLASPAGSAGVALARVIAAGFGTTMLPVNPKSAAQKVRMKWEPASAPSGWLWFGNFVATLTLASSRMECIYEQAVRMGDPDDESDDAGGAYADRRLFERARLRATV
jgi:hypothetical protein